MQAAAAEGCPAFSLGRKIRMICENHKEAIIGNATKGFLEQNLVSYLVSTLSLSRVCFLYGVSQLQTVNLYLWT